MNAESNGAMDANVELLGEVIYGAAMGQSACSTLLAKTSDADMKGALSDQLEQYGAVRADAESELRAHGREPVQCRVGEIGLKLGVQLNTLADTSPSHIAEMMIEGATMGLIDITRAQHRYAAADAQAAGLAQRLCDIERGGIEYMETRLN